MIIYEPNKHFLTDISHLAKSWTMVKIVRSVLAIGLYSAAVCFGLFYFDLGQSMEMNLTVYSFLGVVLSILLVFRTNNSYDRWWEGRKQWGALVNHCRNLAVQIETTFPKDAMAEKHTLAKHISNFCFAFKEHLRKGVDLDILILLSDEEKAEYANKSHIPNHISLQIHQEVYKMYQSKGFTDVDHLNIKIHTQALLDILGACERIKKTPIPFSYSIFIKIFILFYGILLPFAIFGAFGFYTIPIVMMIFFAFIGVEMLGAEIEEPFGLDCNDLPTGSIAHTIKENVFEILEQRKGHEQEQKLYEKIH